VGGATLPQLTQTKNNTYRKGKAMDIAEKKHTGTMAETRPIIINMDQEKIANQIVNEINATITDLEELTASVILDVMGIVGVEFVGGNGGSHTFMGIA